MFIKGLIHWSHKLTLNPTIPPKEIFIWHNFGVELPQINDPCVTISSCSSNLGVWARFAYALNCKSDYICIFDDDAIPGRKWFEKLPEYSSIT